MISAAYYLALIALVAGFVLGGFTTLWLVRAALRKRYARTVDRPASLPVQHIFVHHILPTPPVDSGDEWKHNG